MSDEYTRLIIQQELMSFGLITEEDVNKKRKRAQYAKSETERGEIEEGIPAHGAKEDVRAAVTPSADTTLPRGIQQPPGADQGTPEAGDDPDRQSKGDREELAAKERKEIEAQQKKESGSRR